MGALLLADADLRSAIARGLRLPEQQVDFVPARGLISDATSDPEVLAADLNGLLVSHDFKTMPGHFYGFLEMRESPGVILIPQLLPLFRLSVRS